MYKQGGLSKPPYRNLVTAKYQNDNSKEHMHSKSVQSVQASNSKQFQVKTKRFRLKSKARRKGTTIRGKGSCEKKNPSVNIRSKK